MATGKKYYWIKLKTDFMTSDKVDYLMSKPNGAEYIVLYQMLCMKCINTDGFLARQIGEVIIPFDAEKIARDCKYFKIDTVTEALRLFIQLGMIYQETNGYLRIANFENMVGSETDWAERKRIQRTKREDEIAIEDGQSMDNVQENVHEILDTDIRDRDRNLNNINSEPARNQKHKYGEFKNVLLTEKEYNNFIDEFGEDKTKAFIQHYSELKEMKGYKYKSDYLALKKWGIKSYLESCNKGSASNQHKDLSNKIQLEEN